MRLEPTLKVIQRCVDLDSIRSVLDIGSNRGYFLRHLAASHPHLELVGIEPDPFIVDCYRDNPAIELLRTKFENATLNGRSFQLIHSIHTFEHMVSSLVAFRKAFDVLADGGFLFLEVPRTQRITSATILFEYFIDNHLFHFTRGTIRNYLSLFDFELLHEETEDQDNLTFLLRKRSGTVRSPDRATMCNEFVQNLQMVRGYEERRGRNLAALKKVGRKINDFVGRHRVAIWGASRIFDILCRYGALDLDRVVAVVDKYLCDYVAVVNGIRIQKPDSLSPQVVDSVIVCSDAYYEAIKTEARELLGQNVSVHHYTDFFQASRLAA
ncbi:MAG: class I SAM-dependent methyltransferase [Planctomycetes bacterium]|nr:class I SAM-dependent methyltransferase [Planctomycetota bacterium]